MEERRANERYRIWFPMTVLTESGEEGTAITYDVSAAGVFMACAGRLELGARITLRFRVGEEEPERVIAAQVIRVEPSPEPDSPWRFRMAVAFDAPEPDLERTLVEHADEQS